MFNFLNTLFPRLKKSRQSGQAEPVLAFRKDPSRGSHERFVPKKDVHKLMIRATSIRKKEGYPAAIEYLRKIASYYLEEQNTALVVCMNKLIPYMKKEPGHDPDKIKEYLQQVIDQAPDTDPYFLNLHITMSRLIKSYDLSAAIEYLDMFISDHGINLQTYNHQIEMVDYLIDSGNFKQAESFLEKAHVLLNDHIERFDHIKKERKWHRSAAKLFFQTSSPGKNRKFLFHRFVEFALDLAHVLDPMDTNQFHERKDLYYKNERGFALDADYVSALNQLGLESNQKEGLLREMYGFCFEEMPSVLGVPERQLHFKPGDEETLEELREKKLFTKRAFKELPEIEAGIEKILERHIRTGS